MERKKMTLRFNLSCPEDRQAWEYLQSIKGVSMNRAILSVINQVERANKIQKMFRRIVQEEIITAMKQVPVQPVQAGLGEDHGLDDTIMSFLDNFM